MRARVGPPRIHVRFIATLKLSFKFSLLDRPGRTKKLSLGKGNDVTGRRGAAGCDHGEAEMAIEITGAYSVEPKDAEGCFALGMNYSAGAGVTVDLIEAHKWFNIAAMRGHADAARLRREIAEQMLDAEIGCAQRAARDWLKSHPQPVRAPAIRAAA
jgi:hypothetical protein